MPKGNSAAIHQLTRLFDEGTLAGLTEGELLDRFLSRRDESAFEALVERHSPLVMGVCLKILGNPHDAEDAFQATFLLLARKAGSVRHRKLLSGWLHRVAYRVATRSGRSASRRRAFEKPDSATTETAVSPSSPSPDLARIVHEELARLSDNDRAAVVLCDLEGLTHSEAASRLNWPVGTVKGRLSRARDRLRLRLSRRGLTLPAALLTSTLSIESKASVSRSLITSTAHAAALASAGHALSGTISASALALATGVSRTMMLGQIKLFASLFLAGSLLAAGTGAVLSPDGKPSKADPPEPKAEADPPEPKAEAGQTTESRSFSGKVVEKGTGKPIDGATVIVQRYLWPDPATGLVRLIAETRHRTGGDGDFQYEIPPEQLAEPRLQIVLKVEHPDYPPESYDLGSPRDMLKYETLGDKFPLVCELRPGKPCTGTVVTPDGKPAAGIKVQARSNSGPEPGSGDLVILLVSSVSEMQTDGQGRFRFVAVTPGEATISICPEDFAMSVHQVSKGKRGDLGQFVMEKGIVLSGKVLDAEGNPLGNIIVNAEGSPKAPEKGSLEAMFRASGLFSRSAITDAKGEFTLPPLHSGVYTVKPVESDNDVLLGKAERPLPAPFAPQKLTLRDEETPTPLVFRPLPSVTVEARVVDSKGKPRNGLSLSIGGALPDEEKDRPPVFPESIPLIGPEDLPDPARLVRPPVFPEIRPLSDLDDRDHWYGQGWPVSDEPGKYVLHAPRGLKHASLSVFSMMGAGNLVFRHRTTKDEPLRAGNKLRLDPFDHDFKDIEIVAYESPVILVKVVASDGSRPQDVQVKAVYRHVKATDEEESFPPRSEVHFTEQHDGRFRSFKLLPDEEVTVTAEAKGFAPKSATLTLPEGSTRTVELVLDKE